ncbi:MAG TPA: response regulator [Clostridia bacterium]|nr:response regulator [Clostridia bacterium]
MKHRIVIADDEPITRMDIYEILTEAGYEVVGQATDGFQTVELCRALTPDLAIVDIKMPNLDGLKASKLILNENLVDSVILLTAYSGPDFIEQAKEAGVIGYIVKPVSENTLIPEIEIAISRGKELRKIKNEMNKAQMEIAKRKVIDKAKKILMKKFRITEDEAYKKLRNDSMNQRITLYDLALSIIENC